MFKWPGTPSPRAPAHELADFAELMCWKNRGTSTTAIGAALGRLEENDYSGGVPEEEETPNRVAEAYLEIERRREWCRGGYPYVTSGDGYTLAMDADESNRRDIVYRYLLLATRLNRANCRVHANIDGALLLEELAADVAREYLGDRAESLVFGTSSEIGSFTDKVNDLCRKLKEGGIFVSHTQAPLTSNDGKLDVVVWKGFTDQASGKIIAFGQCKTGTNYRDSVSQLQPDSFCRKWLQPPPAVTPIRMFFAAEALSRLNWYNDVSDAGLLFDRCRIVDFCDSVTEEVLAKVRAWTEAAAMATTLPM